MQLRGTFCALDHLPDDAPRESPEANATVYRINAGAEKRITDHFVAEFTRIRGKAGCSGRSQPPP
ncbi:hypothetical protein ACFWA5_20470 [Streptomyces mirabilis]|uniref:hypothetical protein n=1 Tax=Streptomyces mirabilis TaxID=68239 RepID=UPI00365B3543